MKLHDQIKKYRQEYGFSQEDLADKIHVSRQTISNWENKKSYPDVDSLLLLSLLFNVSLNDLVEGDLGIMKRVLMNHDLDIWTKIMLVFLSLGVVVGIPLTYLFSKWGFAVAIMFFIIGISASIKVDSIKRKGNLRTYQEIIAFTEGRKLSDDEKIRDRNGYWKVELLMFIGSALITAIISEIILLFIKLL